MRRNKDIIKALERDAAMRIAANDIDEAPSNEVQKIHALFQNHSQPRKCITTSRCSFIIGRAAIALSCVLIIGCFSAYAFPIMLDQRIDHLIEQKGDVKVFNTSNNNLVLTETELIVPTYIPTGYEGNMYGIKPPYSMVMQNGSNQKISLIQSTIEAGGTLDAEAKQSTVKISEKDAILEKRPDNSLRLMWEYKGFYFTLEASALPESELIKVAESIK